MPSSTRRQRGCATHTVSDSDRRELANLESSFRRRFRVDESQLTMVVKVAFIHFVHGEQGAITELRRAQQIDVLNKAFKPHNIQFRYTESDVHVVDSASFFRMRHESGAERQAKTAHQALDSSAGLNFYTAEPPGGTLGWATFPFEREGDPKMDGVVMLHGTLPGGDVEPYNLGMTAVHEVGHWLGLYHTFQDGCFGDGDEVEDTPRHASPNFGKPSDAEQPHNVCPAEPAGALCPIHNYMNYVDDDWMTELTPGQVQRIWAQVAMFRPELLAATAGGLESDGMRVRW